MIRSVAVLVVIIIVGYTGGPTKESLTASVSSRIATHSDDPSYATMAEQYNRSIDVNSQFRRLKNLQQYSNIVELARTRQAELEQAIVKIEGMRLVAQERDRALTPIRDEQNQMLRVIAAASDVQ
jgi:hypothetical protein